MGPEILRRAFDPFFTTKPSGAGAGLGLAVARGIVEANGGSLRLESAPGAGTTAVVELPDAFEITPRAP
jgi:signal transduction histidine kinase